MKKIRVTSSGKKPITLEKGGLHRSTGTPQGQKISESKHEAARSGALGPRAKQQEVAYENILKGHGGRKRGK